MAGFDVKDLLNKNSKSGDMKESAKARFKTRDISIFKMYPNKKNFYKIEDVEELAADILVSGLKQNLEVKYDPTEDGEYRIITGERRWRALTSLVEKGFKEFEMATCKVTDPQTDEEEQLEIIIANTYRNKSMTDLLEEEKRLKDCLETMKKKGQQIKGYDLNSGRLRDIIAKILNTSSTKVAQIDTVNKNLIPEWQQELKDGNLTFRAGYELSGIADDKQKELFGEYLENGELTYKEIKEFKEGLIKLKEEEQMPGQIKINDVLQCDTKKEPKYDEDFEDPADADLEEKNWPIKTKPSEKNNYDQEQNAIDKKTKKILEEKEDEEKMNNLPSDNPDQEESKAIKVSWRTMQDIKTGEKRYLILKDNGYKKGDVIITKEIDQGVLTGRTEKIKVIQLNNSEDSTGVEKGYCVLGFEIKKEKQVQKDFPKLKNMDQREEWLRNYKEWPLWMENKDIEEKFYKYNLPDGNYIIVREYPYEIQNPYFVQDPERIERKYYLITEKTKHLQNSMVSLSILKEHLMKMGKEK